jgi:uncharacterized protein YbgA (DUF1722 family)/uncharacterized protein YbbK (DUF523 family)
MIKVGISQCLLGAKVRFDGGHKNSRFCSNELSQLFEFTPLCPEVGIGLPIPRKTIRLVGHSDSPKAVLSVGGEEDYTEQLSKFADENIEKIKQLSGYILMKGSPSCGMERVKVYNQHGQSQSNGVGIFAARLKQLVPHLPMEEDGRLNDPLLRDSFIKRVYLYSEWQQLTSQARLSVRDLMNYHTKHKMTLLAHCQRTYRKLGPMVAQARANNINEIGEQYIALMLEGMKKTATRSNNTNVLLHLQGHLKKLLNREDRAELRNIILDYNKGLAPIMAPIILLKHHFKNNPNPYIKRLSFFSPYPKQLAIQVAMK